MVGNNLTIVCSLTVRKEHRPPHRGKKRVARRDQKPTPALAIE